MVGLQATAFKDKLKSKLNSVVITRPGYRRRSSWRRPRISSRSIGTAQRPKASIRSAIISAAGAHAYFQVLQQAVEGTKSLDDGKLADYLQEP